MVPEGENSPLETQPLHLGARQNNHHPLLLELRGNTAPQEFVEDLRRFPFFKEPSPKKIVYPEGKEVKFSSHQGEEEMKSQKVTGRSA